MIKNHCKLNLGSLFNKPKKFALLLSGFYLSSILLVLVTAVFFLQTQSQDLESRAVNLSYSCAQIDSIPNAECQALLQIYEKTGGDTWIFNTGETRWFATNTPCSWGGVNCDGAQRVISLNLHSKNLTGNLPATIWGSLAYLKHLDLGANKLLLGALPNDIKYIILDKFLTKESGVCLPSTLDSWYLNIKATDEIIDCDGYIQPMKTCNQDCSYSNECVNNLLCYSITNAQKCRLADNPTDDQCRGVDKGLQFECNHYCANTGECAQGFTCWYNRCRQPENVESESCLPPTTQIKALIAKNCNQACQSNQDCAINMRCFGGLCRLASHPESSICTPIAPINKTAKKTKGDTTQTANLTVTPTGKPTAKLSLTPTSSLTPMPTVPATTVTPTPAVKNNEAQKEKTDQNQSIFQNLAKSVAHIKTFFTDLITKNSGTTSTLTAQEKNDNTQAGKWLLGGGVVLLLLTKLISQTTKPKQKMTQDHTNTTPPPSSMISKLKAKNISPPTLQ